MEDNLDLHGARCTTRSTHLVHHMRWRDEEKSIKSAEQINQFQLELLKLQLQNEKHTKLENTKAEPAKVKNKVAMQTTQTELPYYMAPQMSSLTPPPHSLPDAQLTTCLRV